MYAAFHGAVAQSEIERREGSSEAEEGRRVEGGRIQ